MNVTPRHLSALYRRSHDQMRNADGLQPPEAFDELLKYLFLKENADEKNHQFPKFSYPILGQELVALNRDLTKSLRHLLKDLLGKTNSWSSELWRDRSFRLSDSALLGVHELFENIDFSAIDIDTRSAALNEFMPSELRKGLGIFPTPDGVAQMMVEIASPTPTSRVFDPACGTGTFLIEVFRRCGKKYSEGKRQRIWGVDKSARMLLLSELNLGHNKDLEYRRVMADSLYQTPSSLFEEIDGGFDLILTNPPFGVVIDRSKNDMTSFQTCKGMSGDIVKRQQSEVIFVEQCIKYLKPGGLLGIVLPRSIATNSSLHNARLAISSLGYLEAIVNLPSETFSVSGVQINTIILFIRRYRSISEKTESTTVASIDIDNVGFDSTGRPRTGSQLSNAPRILRDAIEGRVVDKGVRLFSTVSKGSSIASLPEMLSRRMINSNPENSMVLSKLLDAASNGRTPGRGNYSSDGLFLVKVGNLTGQGISWEARDRNFISGAEEKQRQGSPHLMLKKGDILLTSSAHASVYIAKKVDVVGTVPGWLGGKASYVGEVMMLRPRDDVDSYILAAYLRLPSTRQQIQLLARGQTAHLHPKDLLEMQVPKTLIKPPVELRRLAAHIRKEAQLSEEMNRVGFEQRRGFIAVENQLHGVAPTSR